MRARFVAWSLGFLSVVWLAGCQSDRNVRSDSCPAKASAGCPCAAGPDGRPSIQSSKPAPKQSTFLPAPGETSLKIINPADLSPIVRVTPMEPDRTFAGEITSGTPVKRVSSTASRPLPPIVDQHDDLVIRQGPSAADSNEDPAVPAKHKDDKINIVPIVSTRTSPETDPTNQTKTEHEDKVVLADALKELVEKVAVNEKAVPVQTMTTQSGPPEPYKSITGEVQQWRNTWRLRYAPIDVEEKYGGSVILDGIADTSKLRDGQRIRVEGKLIPPSNRVDAAHYNVQSLNPLD